MAHVMIVDDDPVQRSVLQSLLKAIGCSSIAFSDGARIVDKLRAVESAGRRVDLVLLDLDLGATTGTAACQSLRAAGLKVPVVCCSADAERGGVRDMGGFDGALSKPFSLDELRACVSSFTGPRSVQGRVAEE